jgi:hypothetical protein
MMNVALHCCVQRGWQSDNHNSRDESIPKLFSWCSTNRRKPTHKVTQFHTRTVTHDGATGMFSSCLVTFLILSGTSLKPVHSQLCGACVAYERLRHSWWSADSRLTARHITSLLGEENYRYTQPAGVPSWWNMASSTNCGSYVAFSSALLAAATVPSVCLCDGHYWPVTYSRSLFASGPRMLRSRK